jgi:ribosome-associated toxin RatA of RatAB toxin-antitoxin module
MKKLFRKQKRQLIILAGCSVFFFQISEMSEMSAWANSPLSISAKAGSAISLNAQEQQTMHKKAVLVRERPTNGKPGKIFEAVASMEADREVILDIVLNYARYPDFMPNVSLIDILEQDESTAVLNYTFSLPLGKIKKYRVRMKASEPDNKTSLIQWQLEQWPGLKQKETIRDTTGFWRIEELDAKRSLVLYHVYTDPGKIPFGLGWIVDLLGKNSVPEVLLQTKERAERVSSLLKAQGE